MTEKSHINSESIIEALIFSSSEPVTSTKLYKIAGISTDEIPRIVERINAGYRQNGKSFEIRLIGGGYAFYVLPDFAPWINELLGRDKRLHLTRSMFEVLAITAVKQPITKPIIDKIRGVNSFAPLTHLLKQGLITIRGRAHSPGRPFLYGTTNKFLKVFGINSIKDIPSFEELEKLFEDEKE